MMIIGYYTTDPVYTECYNLLSASLDRLGLTYEFRPIDPGEWKYITDLKPTIVSEMLEKYQEPVLYVDVDAFVHHDLNEYFENLDCDVAVHYLDRDDGTLELLSGTIYFSYSEKVLELVSRWYEVGKEYPKLNDQQSLQLAIEKYDGLDVIDLDLRFTYIFDRKYKEKISPYVEHLQASREYSVKEKNKELRNRIKLFFGIKSSSDKALIRRRNRIKELWDALER